MFNFGKHDLHISFLLIGSLVLMENMNIGRQFALLRDPISSYEIFSYTFCSFSVRISGFHSAPDARVGNRD